MDLLNNHSEGSLEYCQKGIRAILNYDIEAVMKWAEEVIKKNIDPVEAIEEGLTRGIRIIGDMFEKHEIFLPEIMAAAEVLKAGLEILLPEVLKKRGNWKSLGKVVIGTVEGDIHDLGKNIVIAMLMSSGFEVYDLGVDVTTEDFIEKVRELSPDILGMSAIMSTTARAQKIVIEALEREGLRHKVKVVVGGSGATQEWADRIGADGYGRDWVEALRKAKELVAVIT